VKIKQVRHIVLEESVPVYDLTVPGTENFLLDAGVFVHNSKDVADAACGAYTTMVSRRASWVDAAEDDEAKIDDRYDGAERYDDDRVY